MIHKANALQQKAMPFVEKMKCFTKHFIFRSSSYNVAIIWRVNTPNMRFSAYFRFAEVIA